VYLPGASVVITAGLTDGTHGLIGALVSAEVIAPTAAMTKTAATDLGNGTYRTVLSVPQGTERMAVRITASGTHEAAPFERAALQPIYVASGSVAPTGQFSDAGRDPDRDGLLDRLEVTVGITSTRPGRVVVAGDLIDGEGRFVAHSVASADLVPGANEAVLPFDGDEIRASGIDGRYRLTALTIVHGDGAMDPLYIGTDTAWTTTNYLASDFAATCFALKTGVDPDASGRVVASPQGNCNRGRQYAKGTVVELDAWENTGFQFVEWTGDVSGTEPAAQVVMTRDFEVGARFAGSITPTATPTIRPTPTATPWASPSATATPVPPASSTPQPTRQATNTTAPGPTQPSSTPTPPRPPGGAKRIYLPSVAR
jgi:hypothetical protein